MDTPKRFNDLREELGKTIDGSGDGRITSK